MTDDSIGTKALALVNEVNVERGYTPYSKFDRDFDHTSEALYRAIEQHEATKKEIERLNGVIIATADHWLALQTEHPIAWEGAIDEAMAAACAKICELTEQNEAFKQDVSDVVQDYSDHVDGGHEWEKLISLIIPKPKPDPLVEIMEAYGWYGSPTAADNLRAALESRGFEIVEKK